MYLFSRSQTATHRPPRGSSQLPCLGVKVIRCLSRAAAPGMPALRSAGMDEAPGPSWRGPPWRGRPCVRTAVCGRVWRLRRDWQWGDAGRGRREQHAGSGAQGCRRRRAPEGPRCRPHCRARGPCRLGLHTRDQPSGVRQRSDLSCFLLKAAHGEGQPHKAGIFGGGGAAAAQVRGDGPDPESVGAWCGQEGNV